MSETATPYQTPADLVWESMDPVGEALHFLRMSGVFYTRSELTEPWGLALPALDDCLMFHVITSGQAWLDDGRGNPRRLEPGMFAMVPHGEGHNLLSEPSAHATDLFDTSREQISERYEILRHGGGGHKTHMVCGAVRFDHPSARQLVGLLPDRIIIEAAASPDMMWMETTLRLMAAEAGQPRTGGEALITRLADILVIQAIRAWMTSDPAAQQGWLGALQDEHIGRALALIHRDPSKDWSVGSLAAEVAMSRSAFAARFGELVGQSPMRYVAKWRMNLACGWLEEEDAPLMELALRLGYQSEAAFSRAFKRIIGRSPGKVRQDSKSA